MEANSCLQENMINDSCCIYSTLQAKITTNIIMFNYERVTMEANSCLQENMINDSCCIFHSYKQKINIMFNYDTDSIQSSSTCT